ncbi:MAG: hypothetical protein KC561_17900, partial [Myxococcales bacterium]|nr:hypothetical protein [Myxococcales bacterium]
READFERVVNELAFEIQVGLWHDLEFHINIPIVLGDSRDLTFSSGDGGTVTRENSAIDPADDLIQDDLNDQGFFDTYRYFELEGGNQGPTRSGFGDLSFGLSWAPFNSERQPHLATLALGFDYVAPTAPVARASNTSPGRGVHEIQFSIAASRRFAIVDPYFGMLYALPIATSDSLFADHGGGQEMQSPGMRGEILGGVEFIVWERPEEEQVITVDVGLDFGYQAAGRDYSPISDALMSSSCGGTTPGEVSLMLDGTPYEPAASVPVNSAACAWITQQTSSRIVNPAADPEDELYTHDGITTQDAYITMGGHVGVNAQISPYVELRIGTTFTTETERFITAARTGVDRDNDGEVDFTDPNERNPVYNPTMDSVGNRFRIEGVLNIDWHATLAFQF